MLTLDFLMGVGKRLWNPRNKCLCHYLNTSDVRYEIRIKAQLTTPHVAVDVPGHSEDG